MNGAALCLGSLLLVAFSLAATGAETKATMGVSLVLNPGCSVSAAPLNFGMATTVVAPIDANTTVVANCTNSTPYRIGMDPGVGAGATVDTRYLTGPSASVAAYSLYRDASRSSVWGNTQGVNTVSGQGTGQAQSYTVYGRVAGTQASPVPGPYADTVTVYVYY